MVLKIGINGFGRIGRLEHLVIEAEGQVFQVQLDCPGVGHEMLRENNGTADVKLPGGPRGIRQALWVPE